jgi:hypothetical protein
MMDITFKSIVHSLRLSGIEIPKNVLLPSQLSASVSSSEEEDVHGSEEKDAHDHEEEHVHDNKEDACGRDQDHWNANGDEENQVHSDSRSLMLDIIDKLTCATRTRESLSISKGLPFSTGARWVCCGATYLCVGQCGSIPSACTK